LAGEIPRTLVHKLTLAAEVVQLIPEFDAQTLWYWSVSLSEIAGNPYPRFGEYSEQLTPGLPAYTYNYWITEREYASGERVYTFTAEYFDYRLVYAIDPAGEEVEIFAVRARWVYDSMD
jgi:hypothetical protein